MKKPFQYILMALLSTLFVTPFFSNAFGNLKKHGIIETDKTERSLVFSGITWQVRNRAGNPGGNHWSDSKESVWVDDNGFLHLTIRKIEDKWYCSEIYTEESGGYGEYRFYVASNVENFNENVVLGLFTYIDDVNEVDIEFSKWGNAEEKNMGNYVIQPSSTAGNSHNFPLNLNGSYSTHRFIWTQNYIDFKSWHGHSEISNENTLIHQWKYSGKSIPKPGPEELILNLWLFKGEVPSDEKEVEVLIKAVKVNAPPVINDLNLTIPEDTPLLRNLGILLIPGYSSTELKYSIVQGNELDWFSVSNNGEIILSNIADYELAHSQNLKIVVYVGDQTDTATVKITIENVNDNPPVIENADFSIREDFQTQNIIGQLTFSDADGDSLYFEIIAGNTENLYSITKKGELVLEKQLDFETSKYDSLKINVSDGKFETRATVICHITNVLESSADDIENNAVDYLYPNPASDILSITLPEFSVFEIQVLDVGGKILQVNKISQSANSIQLNVADLNPGIYFILLNSKNRTETLKFRKL